MGCDPVTGVYGCWRDANHRGKDFTKVVRALIHCSFQEAKRLISKDQVILQDENIEDYVNGLFDEKEDKIEIVGVDELELPKLFTEIRSVGIKKPFWDYLKSRGLNNDKKLQKLIGRFNIRCCLTGEWKMRLIFPVCLHDELVTWQSRSIYKAAMIPYKDLSKEESVVHVKECIYNYDELLEKGGYILYITEGIFDCLKIEYFGIKDVNATCIFTKTLRDSQIYQLKLLSAAFEEVRLLLDEDAWSDAYFDIGEQLSFIPNFRIQQLPEGVGDPGELRRSQFKQLVSS
jgi:hypothetical protein